MSLRTVMDGVAKMRSRGRLDVRFSMPLYTQAEAARYLGMSDSTFKYWTHAYDRPGRTGKIHHGAPIITRVQSDASSGASVPFIGLAEAVFLAALRSTRIPLQRIRPAVEEIQKEIGVDYALASKRLHTDGAELLWEVSAKTDLGPGERSALVVVRNGQYVFREVVEQYLQNITYGSDGFAIRVELPGYEVARLIADPDINFGRPFFASNGAPVSTVLSRLHAGEPLPDVADDYDLDPDEVREVADRRELVSA